MTCPNPPGYTLQSFMDVLGLAEVEELIKCLSDFPHVGIAVLDSHFRYLRLNRALASMNGVPADYHAGKTIREILGPAARQLEPRLERVFTTGKSIRFELEARLLNRTEMGRWDVMYFPIRNQSYSVESVCAVIREIAEGGTLKASLFGLSRKLTALRAIINRETNRSIEITDAMRTREALGLLNVCISEIVAVSNMPDSELKRMTREIVDEYDPACCGNESTRSNSPGKDCLTNREHDVVRLISEGKCNKEIASALGLSVRTVEHYRTNAMSKLDAHSLVDLIRFAARRKIISI